MNGHDLKVLNELYKASMMGIESITYLKDKIKDRKFKKEVRKQLNNYKKISMKIEKMMSKYNGRLEEIPTKDKVMVWASVNVNTLIDDTSTHLSEMLIQGTIMGVIEGVRLSKNENISKKVRCIVNKFIWISENNIQNLKQYL